MASLPNYHLLDVALDGSFVKSFKVTVWITVNKNNSSGMCIIMAKFSCIKMRLKYITEQ